jgi:hypothetical protein
MKLDDSWSLLGIFKAGSLTVFSILFIALMGGAFQPVVGHFFADVLLWLGVSVALAAIYVRAAYVYRRRQAAQMGKTVHVLATLSDVAYEVLALLGGGFFGILFASLAWDEYHKAGAFAGYAPLMSVLSAIGLGGSVVSLVKLGRYLRTDITVRGL